MRLTPTPTLVAAELDGAAYLVLTFSAAVQWGAYVPGSAVVDDGAGSGMKLSGVNVKLATSPTTIVLNLAVAGPATGPGTTLTAGAVNGIVSAENGAAWGGVANVPLPLG
jgi:hypothetical protein